MIPLRITEDSRIDQPKCWGKKKTFSCLNNSWNENMSELSKEKSFKIIADKNNICLSPM